MLQNEISKPVIVGDKLSSSCWLLPSLRAMELWGEGWEGWRPSVLRKVFKTVLQCKCMEVCDLYFPVFALPGLAVVVLRHPEV